MIRSTLRRRLFGGLLAALTGTAAITLTAPPASAASTDYIIGQFNIAGGNNEYGKHGMEAPDALVTSVQTRGSKLAFVTLQEGCRDWMERLREKLPDYEVAYDAINGGNDDHPVRCYHEVDNPKGDQVNAILYRKDFGIDTAPVAYDLGTPRDKEHREMLCVASQARKIVICSAHLSSGDLGDRRNEAARAADILRTTYAGYTRMVGGDMNDDPLSAVSDNFYAPGYEHGAHGEFKEVDTPCGNDVKEGYDSWIWDPISGFPMPYHTVCRSGETTHKGLTGQKIDYLFVPLNVTVHSADATSSKYSDHIPLWADITVPENPADPGGGGGEPANRPPVVYAGPSVAGDEGGVITLRGAASDDGTGAPAVSWSYRSLEGAATCSFGTPNRPVTTFTCTDNGTFEVTLTADDGVNPPVSDSTEVTVANTPPKLALNGPKPWQVFRAGTAVPVTAPFTDAGADTHTCAITWDDGSTDSFAGSGSCDRSHTFAHAGMYTLKVQVTDDDDGSDSATVLVIVYDPDAGFVTGGGNTADGHFTLNPKYLPQERLNGKVTYSSGDLSVRSTELEWLVVTGYGKAAAKGTAEVNGEAGYGFVAYAVDDPGNLRVVVWKLSDGAYPDGTVVHDNNAGASYDLDAADPPKIRTGSIKIHA